LAKVAFAVRRLLPELAETLGFVFSPHENATHAGEERREGQGRRQPLPGDLTDR
jgi:hypothetical protein